MAETLRDELRRFRTPSMSIPNGFASDREIPIGQIWAALDSMEEAAQARNLSEIGARARYLCVRCNQAYALVCLNPGCRRTTRPKHCLPQELIDGVKAERRAKRQGQHNKVRDLVNLKLWPEQCEAVRAYRRAHPRRRFAITEIPAIYAPKGWSYKPHDNNDPFFQQLAPELGVLWETVRVDLSDGTYQASKATKIDIPRIA